MTDCPEPASLADGRAALELLHQLLAPVSMCARGKIEPHWAADGTRLWFNKEGEDGAPTQVATANGAARPLFARTASAALSAALNDDVRVETLMAAGFVDVGDGRFLFAHDGRFVILSIDDNVVVDADNATLAAHQAAIARFAPEALAARTGLIGASTYLRPFFQMAAMAVPETLSPDGRHYAGIENANLYIRAAGTDLRHFLTHDGVGDCFWDICPGTNAGPKIRDGAWSPAGRYLLARRIDQSKVPRASILRHLGVSEEASSLVYQRAGAPLDRVSVTIFDVNDERAIPVDLGDTTDSFISLVGWLANDEALLARYSRDFSAVELIVADAATGAARVLLREESDSLVALQHNVLFARDHHLTLLPSAGFIRRSARSGWNHLYLYDAGGAEVRELTHGEWAVIDVAHIDWGGGWVYFAAHHDPVRPYDVHLCRVPLAGGGIQRLTKRDGVNLCSVAPSGNAFTVTNSRPDRPERTDLYAADGGWIACMKETDAGALMPFAAVVSEEFEVLAADGVTPLWGVMHRPARLETGHRYPLITQIYGAPSVAYAPHRFILDYGPHERLSHALAALGYVVIILDARGTPERSKAFHDVGHGRWGPHVIADHVVAIRTLAMRHDFIDCNRVGIWGHSWGGYFALRAMIEEPTLFRVGVAASPIADLEVSILHEPYVGLPAHAPAAYDEARLMPRLGAIEGKLMLAGGSADPIVFTQMMALSHALIHTGIDHELVVLPDAGHAYHGADQSYFVEKLVRHFETWLKGATPRDGDGGPPTSAQDMVKGRGL